MDLSVRSKRTVLSCVLLCLLTFLAFRHIGQNAFINYDDPDYITANPHVVSGLTWANVRWAFTATRASNWNPLTWLSHMLDVQLFGLNPRWHHLVNLGIHTANTVLLFLLLLDLTGAKSRSFFVAGLFALHPLHVESVAWASERKDVLSTLFFLLTLWAYAAYVRRLRASAAEGIPGKAAGTARRCYWLALVLYALGLMAKPMLVTLPCLLLLLDYWPLARLQLEPNRPFGRTLSRLLLEKVPFFILAAGSSALTLLSQNRNYSLSGGLPFPMRAATAVTSYVKYLGLLVWPTNLAIFYPDPNARYFAPHYTPWYPASEQWPIWQVMAAALFLLAISVWVVRRGAGQPWLVTGWYWYLGMLVPVIGIVQGGVQVMADRYTYVPLIGLFILIAWGAAALAQRCGWRAAWLQAAGAVVLAACFFATQNQVNVWRNNQTVFAHALAVTSRNPLAEWMIGSDYAQRGQLGLAQTHFRLALAADPYQVQAHSALGSLFELENRLDLATNEYQTSLRLKPSDEFAGLHLAGIWRKLGKTNEALQEYEQTARWNPDSVEANFQAGSLLLDKGDLRKAYDFLENALALNPNHAEALLCLSDLRAQQGQMDGALAALQQVVHLYPTNFELRVNLGSLLWKAGRPAEALAQYREALRLNPAHPMVHYDLGAGLFAQGQLSEAADQFTQAIQLKPDYLQAATDLGRVLSAQGRFKDAQAAFRRAVELAPTNGSLQAQLGTALLMDGQTNEAQTIFARARELQPQLAQSYTAEGKALLSRGELNEALARFNSAVCLDPSSAEALSSLAWLLAVHPQQQMRNGPRALALAQQALRQTANDPRCWAALDAASAETGGFQEALRAAAKSRELALAAGDVAAAQAAEQRMALYAEHRPYRIR